jgi:hypothetical protein
VPTPLNQGVGPINGALQHQPLRLRSKDEADASATMVFPSGKNIRRSQPTLAPHTYNLILIN